MAGKGKELQAVVNLAGSIDPSLGKAIESAQKKISGLNVKALAVGAAVGGIAVATGKAVVEAGKYLKDLGSQFDGAADAIRIGTGATGDALDGLLDDFDEVYKSVPTTMEDASKAIADYNTRLGLTGPQLQEISKQALQVSDMLGDDLGGVIEESSQAFQQWNIDADNMGGAMDYIFKVSQSTGMGFTDLMSNMQKFGPQLQEMGYSFETASALMGQLDKAGVNTEEVLSAMKKSVGALAKEGISASDGLAMYYEQIKNAGTAAEAASIASEIFGTKAGSTMAAAIRDGTLAVGDLTESLLENGETIAGAAEDTYDFAERLQIMKQGLEVALKPMANTVFDGLNKFMPVLQKLMEQIVPVISDAVEAAAPFVEEFLMGAADALEDVLPLISQLAADLLPILTQLMSTLLPPLLSLVQTLLPPLMQIVGAILPPIASLLSTILPMITQIVSAVLPVLVQIISALLPVITPLLEVALQIVNDVIMPLLPPLMQIVQALLPPLVSLLNLVMPILSPLLALLQPIASVLGTIADVIAKIVSFGSGVISKIAGLFGGGGGGGGVSGFATGGFTSGPSIAGEDPRYPTEAVISFNPAYRSENLEYWAKAGQMLGASNESDYELLSGGSSTSVVYDLSGLSFSPQIKIEGDTDEDALIRKLRELEPEFIDFVLEALSRREGGAYVTADSRLY
ncbi:phage tail tape measure protein [Megasphaera sp.]|jgi:TP901 family phage tail tape measure protein|uniref:phage tail tape measure protein n=1 Tax=Megasphaera sp. TaxID=2023260 RepID=UPI0025795A1B|nr:phage tail tape measure protein [Megasphaera sp.]